MKTRRRRRRDQEDDRSDRWLLTYADLVTLLMAFFIVMYSMSRVDADRFARIQQALQRTLGGPGEVAGEDLIQSMDVLSHRPEEELQILAERIAASLRGTGLEDHVAAVEDQRGLVLRILESTAFEPGSAELREPMPALLVRVADGLRRCDNALRVEGHTDNHPIASNQFPSNWELSTARATAVLRYLVESCGIDPGRVSALGYGEYRPVGSNATERGRARNRRVDIVILAEDHNEPLPYTTPNVPLVLADSATGIVP